MQRKQNNQNCNKKTIAFFVIFLVILIPINISSTTAQIVNVPTNQFSNVGQDIISGFQQDPIGEDIIINVDHYDPPVIPTAFIEDQGASVIALLEGTPTNPTIEISRINRIISRPVKITTTPPDKPISLGSIQHFTPRRGDISYDNLGYIVIPIRRIPREADVPDQIDIDMVSRIFFEVSAGLGFGPREDVLLQQEHKDWLPTKDLHSFHSGYIRADEITPTKATFTVQNMKGKRTVEVLDENRVLTSTDGVFEDEFRPYDVHLYRIEIESKD